MIALGVTWPCETTLPGLALRSLGSIAIVETQNGEAEQARGRLRLQVSAASALNSFLPFAPSMRVDVSSAEAWASARIDQLENALQTLEGSCEIVIDLVPATSQAPLAPRQWLRHRAARVGCATRLKEKLAPMAREVRTTVTAQGARIALLIDRSTRDTVARGIEMQCKSLAGSGWSAVLTGPWPALSFQGADMP